MTALPLDDTSATIAALRAYAELGVERVVCAVRYDTPAEYRAQLDRLTGAAGEHR